MVVYYVAMRKVIYGAAVTLDGYIGRIDGSVDYLVMTPDVEKLMAEFFATLDTVVMGRKSWAQSAKIHEGEEPPAGPWKGYVFSRTLPPGEREGTTFVNQSPREFVDELRKSPGKNIFLMGGGELARSFLQDDAIDEVHVGLLPILLGEGIPFFPPGFPQRNFRLMEQGIYDKSSVWLKYERVRE